MGQLKPETASLERFDSFTPAPLKLERESFYQDAVKLYACPSCKKTFIE